MGLEENYGTSFSPGERVDRERELEESTILQVVLYDDVGDSVENEPNVVGVRGAGEMRVDFLHVLPLVQVFEFELDVSCAVLVGLRA